VQRAVKIFELLNPSVHSKEMVRATSVYSPFNHLTQLLAREYFIERSAKVYIAFGCILPARGTVFLMGYLWWADLNQMFEISSVIF